MSRADSRPLRMSETVDMNMRTRTSTGQGYRAGELVSAELVVTETIEMRERRVPIPGEARTDIDYRTVRHPSNVRFVSIDDEDLRLELEQLVAARRDDDLRRQQRDSRWEPAPIDLVLEYERNLLGCSIGWPLDVGYGGVEQVEFPLWHPEL